MTLQCDTSTPRYLCGVNTFFNPQTEFENCNERLVLVGQSTDGSATDGTPHQVLSNEDDLFGENSMLAAMVKSARKQSQFVEIWALPLADFGTKGVSTITFTENLTVATVVSLVVNGKVYSISAAPDDTNAMIAAAFQLVIDDRYLSATTSGDDLILTTSNGGEKAGKLDVRTSYSVLNVSAPSEVDISIDTVQGVGVPTLDFNSLGEAPFTFIGMPYCDTVSMNKLKDHLCSTWGPRMRTRAEGFTVANTDLSGVQALATTLNTEQIHLFSGVGQLAPTYEVTAAITAASYNVLNGCNDPLTISEPVCGVALNGILPPEPEDRPNVNTADILLGSGVSPLGVNADGKVYLQGYNTTYTRTAEGIEDAAFQNGSAVAQLRYIAKYIEDRVQARYSRFSIRSDNFAPRAGQKVVRVRTIHAFIQGLGYDLSNLNVIEDPASWAELVTVTRDTDSGCLNISVSPDLVNKLCCINLFINSRL